jgi:glycosyltransferase involved in cell wall biosynthesis
MLDRLMENDYPNLEIVIADGASTDGTVELLKSYGSRITRWVSEPDEGEYFAYNKALSMASGEIVKLMTDDDMLRPGVLRLGAQFLLEHPEVDIVFGQTDIWDEASGTPLCVQECRTMDTSRLTLRHWLRETRKVTSLAPFIRRRVFEQIGPLATKYSCGDMEFWARAAARGIHMGLMPQVVADYHLTWSNGVFEKRWRIAADMVAINYLYGSASDVLHCVWRKFNPLRLLAYACYPLGIHPRAVWRRWRRELARQRVPWQETSGSQDTFGGRN